MKKKQIDKAEEIRLLKEVTAVFENSVILRKDAEFNHQLIKDFNKKYPDRLIQKMDCKDREETIKKAEVIWARMNISVKELQKLDKKYEGLRQEVNKLYGKSILKKSRTIIPPLFEKDGNEGEEWKKN